MNTRRAAAATAALAAALWLAAPAYADDAPFQACRSKADSTVAIEDCQKAELVRAEAKLKVAYDRALRALPPDQQSKLRDAERRWVAFRAADCQVYYGEQTGTIAGIEAGDCMIRHAADRVRDLATFSEP